MRAVVLLLAVIVAITAQSVVPGLPAGKTDVPTSFTINAETQPFGSNLCAMDGAWKSVDKGAFYKANFPGVKRVCVKDYLAVCATVTGAVACNTYNAACTEVQYDFLDAAQHPESAANMELRPEVCTDATGYTHSDTSVILIAQIVVSGIVLIAGFVFFVLQAQPSPIIKALLAVFLLDCLLLLFGYYYLNAIVIFTAVIAAGICFSLKSDAAAAVGFGICLAALYWTTFQSGLGNVQHQSRFTAGVASTDAYERMCNNYFRGYFFFPLEAHKDNENIANSARGLCDRTWLGAQLFFMIFAQQLLVVFIAAGAFVQFSDPRVGEPNYVSTVETAKPQQ